MRGANVFRFPISWGWGWIEKVPGAREKSSPRFSASNSALFPKHDILEPAPEVVLKGHGFEQGIETLGAGFDYLHSFPALVEQQGNESYADKQSSDFGKIASESIHD
jgi:hypothetical protein